MGGPPRRPGPMPLPPEQQFHRDVVIQLTTLNQTLQNIQRSLDRLIAATEQRH
jgi:hypothetical protein